MSKKIRSFLIRNLLFVSFLLSTSAISAKYESRDWSVRSREDYQASLTSEGVTIAVEPLFKDELAGQVFDKDDIVTRGIIPLAIIIFNDNDFPIEVDGLSIELINGDDRLRTLSPNEVVYRLFKKGDNNVWSPQPMPRVSIDDLDRNALEDFDKKFLIAKTVEAHDKGGGFLYMHIPDSEDIAAYLSNSTIYIPKVYRLDDGSRLIFFEVELKPALDAVPSD